MTNGTVLHRKGHYLIGPEIATGGMATVRLGQLKGAGGFSKLVAIKQLHADLASDVDLATMLIKEAHLNAAISHPNVVSVIDVLEQSGELLLVMDFVHGETLAHLLRRTRQQACVVPVGVALRIAIDVLDGLHAAHTATDAEGVPLRVVHRDVSPQNIMIGEDGVARVLDFGIAKAALGSSFTMPGQVRGKLAYMAPEQLTEQVVDARCDVFAAAVVLWEVLSGRRFRAGDGASPTPSSSPEPFTPPRCTRSGVSLALASCLEKAMAREPFDRFTSAREFANALEASGKPASRAEVAAWVLATAGPVIAQRKKLGAELDQGTMPLVVPARMATPRSSAPHGWLRQRSRGPWKWLAVGIVALAMSAATLGLLNEEQRSAPVTTTELVPEPPPIPASRVAPPTDSSLSPTIDASTLPVPVQAESLPLEPKARFKSSQSKPSSPAGRTRIAAQRRRKPTPSDILGF